MREYLINQLIKEIVGPGIGPDDSSPYKDDLTGEEILLNYVHGTPTQRYGAGILFPQEVTEEIQNSSTSSEDITYDSDIVSSENKEESQPERIVSKETNEAIENENDDDVSTLSNQLKPSAMGLTFRCKTSGVIKVSVKSARYEKATDQKPKWQINTDNQLEAKELQDYFIRRPLTIDPIIIDLSSINTDSKEILRKVIFTHNSVDWLELRINNRSTSHELSEGLLILTVSIINLRNGTPNLNSLFQNEITVSTEQANILVPYRDKVLENDYEVSELNLLYRKRKMFGIGHGCAVVWQENQINENSVSAISTSVLPVYEIPLIASNDIKSIPMFLLSDLCSEEDWEKGKEELHNLESEYFYWIEALKTEVNNWALDPQLKIYKEAAERNIQKCLDNYNRIKYGIELILNPNTNKELIRCFRWMNTSMIWQQQRSKIPLRKWQKVKNKITLDEIEISDLRAFHENGKGRWRPFQLAFVLMNINSIWFENSEDRKILDLIWFPTGGGKTEAYLGLTAFQIFSRRYKAVIDGGFNYKRYSGTTVLMRYTLRLLTIQQYERASSLICACEFIRLKNLSDLGNDPISIGLWVGGKSTPNENSGENGAVNQYNLLRNRNDAEYHFVLMKCPCCGTQIGKLENDVRTTKDRIRGLKILNAGSDQRVVFKCENTNCETSDWNELPLYVVDEDIFKNKPTLLIGTVDKFAMLVWKAGVNDNSEYSYLQAGSIFGFRYNSSSGDVYRILPPQLIIQDELHLISGPLGTIVGLYETMIQTLCNNYLKFQPPFEPSEEFIPPKIIASSATISRANEQTRNLYGINSVNLNIFPPQGIEFGETWFSKVIPTQSKPGRKYLGVLAPGYKSIQTAETRVYSRLLQETKVSSFSENEKNYYWTLVGYFNSIRGLGSASTLINSDISQYLKTLFNRELVVETKKRKPGEIRFMELTSRMDDSEIPRILKILESSFPGDNINRPLDICFATNMIATGVDVSRLGIMIVHGQPKTTAEYIQASSRVGRDIQVSDEKYIGQGLAVTIYSPTKPRDKSHYEQFQSYHSRIYSNVEPTSVTPFSINARERALHSVFIGLIRHFAHGNLRHRPDGDNFFPLAKTIKNIMVSRAEIVDQIEKDNVVRELDSLIENWTNSGIQAYGDAMNIRIMRGERVLMYSASAEIPPGYLRQNSVFPLKVNTSMRGVDFESNLESIQQ